MKLTALGEHSFLMRLSIPAGKGDSIHFFTTQYQDTQFTKLNTMVMVKPCRNKLRKA